MIVLYAQARPVIGRVFFCEREMSHFGTRFRLYFYQNTLQFPKRMLTDMTSSYPTYWQTTISVHAPGELVPCAIDSGDGKTILMIKASSEEIVDRALRASCAEMGSRVGMAAKPTTTQRVRDFGVLNTVSLAWRVGRCIKLAEATNTLSTVGEAIVNEVGGERSAKILFRGKIVGVERRLFQGHSYGSITISSLTADEEDGSESNTKRMKAVASDGTLSIPFKNENSEAFIIFPYIGTVIDSSSF